MISYFKSKFTNQKIKTIYYLSIIPLIIYACYKNGFLIYQKNLGSILITFKPLLIILLVMITSISCDYLINRFLKKEKNLYSYMLNSYHTLWATLFSLSIPINTNIFIILLMTIILNIFLNIKVLSLNKVVLVRIILIIILFATHKLTYLNLYEENVVSIYSVVDLFFGRNIGGIATTNIFLLIISYLILCLIPSYKRYIPLNIILSYLLIMFIFSLFAIDIRDGLKLILNNEMVYASIYLATLPLFSPRLENETLLYSCLIGGLTFILSYYFSLKEGVYLAILLSNLVLIVLKKLHISLDKE